jgi:hypothetical protein
MTPIEKSERSKSIEVYTLVKPQTSMMTLLMRMFQQKYVLMIQVPFVFLKRILQSALPSRVLYSSSLSSLPSYASCPSVGDAKTCPPRDHPFIVDLIPILHIHLIAAKKKIFSSVNDFMKISVEVEQSGTNGRVRCHK